MLTAGRWAACGGALSAGVLGANVCRTVWPMSPSNSTTIRFASVPPPRPSSGPVSRKPGPPPAQGSGRLAEEPRRTAGAAAAAVNSSKVGGTGTIRPPGLGGVGQQASRAKPDAPPPPPPPPPGANAGGGAWPTYVPPGLAGRMSSGGTASGIGGRGGAGAGPTMAQTAKGPAGAAAPAGRADAAAGRTQRSSGLGELASRILGVSEERRSQPSGLSRLQSIIGSASAKGLPNIATEPTGFNAQPQPNRPHTAGGLHGHTAAGGGGAAAAAPAAGMSPEEEAFQRMREQFSRIREEREKSRAILAKRRGEANALRERFRPTRVDPFAATQQHMDQVTTKRAIGAVKLEVEMHDDMTVRSLARAVCMNVGIFLRHMEEAGEEGYKPDSPISPEVAEFFVTALGHTPIAPKSKFVYVDCGVRLGPGPHGVGSVRERVELPSDDVLANFPIRSPVVTVMGHVDHGKTTLLDRLRNTTVAAHEAGGITQSIGAFVVPVNRDDTDGDEPEEEATKAAAKSKPKAKDKAKAKNKKADKKSKDTSSGTPAPLEPGQYICFLDTPGHELFSSMRQRGIQLTDIVVLVVAADDGVMPQTKEVARLIASSGVACVVAVTKIDRLSPHERDEAMKRVENGLMAEGLVPERLGGEVAIVPVSAVSGEGIDELKETIMLQSEVLELRADRDSMGEAVVIESTINKGLGPVADVLVQWGSLKVGDWFVVGNQAGKIKTLIDSYGNRIEVAPPGMPVRVVGLDEVAGSGDMVLVVDDEASARSAVEGRVVQNEFARMKEDSVGIAERAAAHRAKRKRAKEREAFENRLKFLERLRTSKLLAGEELPPDLLELPTMPEHLLEPEDQPQETGPLVVPAMLRADVSGSLEAVQHAAQTLPQDEVMTKFIKTTVGPVTETDVQNAKLFNAAIIAFNVKVPPAVSLLAERTGVRIIQGNVIYRLLEDLEALLVDQLEPVFEDVILGTADVAELFEVTHRHDARRVAGCRVTSGVLTPGAQYRVLRDDEIVAEVEGLDSLKHFQESVKEVKKGSECGVLLRGFDQLRKGDVLQAYEKKSVKRSLHDRPQSA